MVTCGCMFIATHPRLRKPIDAPPLHPPPPQTPFLIYGTGIRNPPKSLKTKARLCSNIRCKPLPEIMCRSVKSAGEWPRPARPGAARRCWGAGDRAALPCRTKPPARVFAGSPLGSGTRGSLARPATAARESLALCGVARGIARSGRLPGHCRAQHVVREKELSVVWYEHDLHLVRKLLRHRVLHQQRIRFQGCGFEFELRRVGLRRNAN